MSTFISKKVEDNIRWCDKSIPKQVSESYSESTLKMYGKFLDAMNLKQYHFKMTPKPSIAGKIQDSGVNQLDYIYSILKSFAKNMSYEIIQQFLGHSVTYEQNKRIESLRILYEFVNHDSIIRYLQNNTKLVEVLESIPENLLKYFHEDDTLVLDTFIDPEEPESEYIQIKIITKLTVKDAFERIERFEIEWFYRNIDFLDPNLVGIVFEVGYR